MFSGWKDDRQFTISPVQRVVFLHPKQIRNVHWSISFNTSVFLTKTPEFSKAPPRRGFIVGMDHATAGIVGIYLGEERGVATGHTAPSIPPQMGVVPCPKSPRQNPWESRTHRTQGWLQSFLFISATGKRKESTVSPTKILTDRAELFHIFQSCPTCLVECCVREVLSVC